MYLFLRDNKNQSKSDRKRLNYDDCMNKIPSPLLSSIPF